jgi:hypothetical protein
VEAEHLPEIITKHAEIDAETVGPEWAMVDGLVVRQGRLFVPATATAWLQVLEHAHGMGA